MEEGKGKDAGDSSATRHDKERLADTHDLLAEISLENERYVGNMLIGWLCSNLLVLDFLQLWLISGHP